MFVCFKKFATRCMALLPQGSSLRRAAALRGSRAMQHVASRDKRKLDGYHLVNKDTCLAIPGGACKRVFSLMLWLEQHELDELVFEVKCSRSLMKLKFKW